MFLELKAFANNKLVGSFAFSSTRDLPTPQGGGIIIHLTDFSAKEHDFEVTCFILSSGQQQEQDRAGSIKGAGVGLASGCRFIMVTGVFL
jgi:hypothetical protein